MVSAWNFLRAVSDRLNQPDRPRVAEFLPDAIASACVDVLPIDGAGISVISDLRLPLGSSGAPATFLERLQFSVGDGPCLAAAASGEAVVVTSAEIADRWPVFATEMSTHTPFRSIASVPVVLAGYSGALNLYSTDPSASGFPPIKDVAEVLAPSIKALAGDPPTARAAGLDVPVWMVNEAVSLRLDLWLGVGMMMEHLQTDSAEALALLRAYGFSHSTPVDAVSRELVERSLTPAEVIA